MKSLIVEKAKMPFPAILDYFYFVFFQWKWRPEFANEQPFLAAADYLTQLVDIYHLKFAVK